MGRRAPQPFRPLLCGCADCRGRRGKPDLEFEERRLRRAQQSSWRCGCGAANPARARTCANCNGSRFEEDQQQAVLD